MQQPKRIMYIGNKPEKTDTVTHSGLYWPHPGAVVDVDYTVAVQLLRHPAVWAEVDEEGDRVEGVARKDARAAGKAPARMIADDSPVGGAAGDAGGDGEGEDEGREAGDTPTVEEVVAAIMDLQRDNPEHFTEQGKPRIGAIKARVGEGVTVKLLNEAWKEIDG